MQDPCVLRQQSEISKKIHTVRQDIDRTFSTWFQQSYNKGIFLNKSDKLEARLLREYASYCLALRNGLA